MCIRDRSGRAQNLQGDSPGQLRRSPGQPRRAPRKPRRAWESLGQPSARKNVEPSTRRVGLQGLH
eukprot:6650374-Karenia_brevis.AAC.1